LPGCSGRPHGKVGFRGPAEGASWATGPGRRGRQTLFGLAESKGAGGRGAATMPGVCFDQSVEPWISPSRFDENAIDCEYRPKTGSRRRIKTTHLDELAGGPGIARGVRLLLRAHV